MKRTCPMAAMLLLASLFPAAVVAEDIGEVEERPRIFLEKKVFASEAADGKKSFFEAYTVAKGDSLWKILSRQRGLSPEAYMESLAEFKKANPNIPDPAKLQVGKKILVPSVAAPVAMAAPSEPDPGRTARHTIVAGDTLSRLMTKRGVNKKDMRKVLAVVRELNPTVKDVNRIRIGKTLVLPTSGYFDPNTVTAATVVASVPASEPSSAAARPSSPVDGSATSVTPSIQPAASSVASVPVTSNSSVPPPVVLTKDVAKVPATEGAPVAKAEGALAAGTSDAPPAAPALVVGSKDGEAVAAPPSERVPAKMPWRGLLSDVTRGLGEKWTDKGMLYLPVPAGGEVVIDMAEFPMIRFSTGVQAIVDFRGALDRGVVDLLGESWKSYRFVSLADAGSAREAIEKILRSAGYHSVKDGLSSPLVVGEAVSVSMPARFVVLKTRESLDAGDVILVKEAPEKPSKAFMSIVAYGNEVGISTLAYAADQSARDGFLVGMEESAGDEAGTARRHLGAGLDAVDATLDLLGLAANGSEKIVLGGKEKSFRLEFHPDRTFLLDGRKIVVDSGKITQALKSLLKDAGFEVFSVGSQEKGRDVFARLCTLAGVSTEERKDFLVSGGPTDGFEVRVTGTFVTDRKLLERRGISAVAVVRGRVHSATAELLRELGVETVGW